MSGMNNQLGQMLRSAALMYDSRRQEDVDANSSSSSSDEEDEMAEGAGDAYEGAASEELLELHGAGEDLAGTSTSLDWTLRKEQAALADAKDRKHRKAIFKRIDGLRRRQAACE